MIRYELDFSYNKKNYKALVQQENGNPIQFLVNFQQPHDLKIDEPFILQNEKDKVIEYSYYLSLPGLGHSIASAISKYCEKNGIPLK